MRLVTVATSVARHDFSFLGIKDAKYVYKRNHRLL